MVPFRVEIPQADLDDLYRRLDSTRWPGELPGAGWGRGVPLRYLKELAEYWRTGCDWRAAEARLNQFPQFTGVIGGARVHLLHVRSPGPRALPLLLTHGWPGSVAEFLHVIGPLTDPGAHGGDPAGAFHLVIPAISGYGFSGPTGQPGWGFARIAAAWAGLMRRLGYGRCAAQGGDVGALISLALAGLHPDRVAGVHVNFLPTPPPGDPAQLAGRSEPERARLGQLARFAAGLSGCMKVQSARPRTLAYGLTGSPGRPARLDRRTIPGVDRLGGGSRGRGRPRPAAHQRHALLADRHGRVLGAAVREDRRAAPDRRGAAAASPAACAAGGGGLPARHSAAHPALRRPELPKDRAVDRVRPGRSLRRPGRARLARGRPARVRPHPGGRRRTGGPACSQTLTVRFNQTNPSGHPPEQTRRSA